MRENENKSSYINVEKLIRILIVVLILGIFAAILIPLFSGGTKEECQSQEIQDTEPNSVEMEPNSTEPNWIGDPRDLVDMPVP